MKKNSELKKSWLIFSILLCSVLSVFLALTLAYITNLIYLIGDYSEVMPLLIGIIAGAIIFSVIGAFLNERKKVNIVYTAIMSIVTIAIAYMILYFYSFVNPNAVIMCVGLLINSPYSVFVEASNYISKNSKLKNKIPVAIIIAVIGIILVLLFAIIYENSGQTIFPQGVFISALITLIALVILLFYPKRSKITN